MTVAVCNAPTSEPEANLPSLRMWRSLDRVCQLFPVANKHHLLNSPGHGGIEEGAIEQSAPRHRNDHALELASLGLSTSFWFRLVRSGSADDRA
jgi:hypothetical protein